MTAADISLKNIWQELRPAVTSQKSSLIVGAVALAFLGLSQALFLLLIKGFIKALFSSAERTSIPIGELLPHELLRAVTVPLDFPLARADLAIAVPAAIIAAGLLMSVALYYYQYNQQAISMFVAKYLRERLFSRILSLDFSRIAGRSAGQWMSVIMNDIMFLQNRFSDLLTALFKDTVVIVSCFFVLLFIHFPTALVLLAIAPFIAFGMGRTGKRIARFAEKFQGELARISSIVLNIRERFEFIRAQHGEQRELGWFKRSNTAYYLMIRKSILIRSAFAPMMELVGFVIFAALVWGVGAGYWQSLTPALLMQFFVAVGLMLRPLREVGEQVSRLQETRGAMAECLALLRMRAEDLAPEQTILGSEVKKIVVNELAGGYGRMPVFQGERLTFEVGRSLAIVGPSGSGKSTLIKTLAGLVAPMAWDSSTPWSSFASSTSLVSQEPFLFDDTVRANLLYGLAGVIPNDAMLKDALRQVKLDTESIDLDAHFRALGTNLSGGQIQRLVIARSLLRQKRFLLLDEATSAVDAAAEESITRALTSMSRDGSIGLIAITHRLEWLSLYDEIWFLEAGRIVARGPLAELKTLDNFCAFLSSGPEPA